MSLALSSSTRRYSLSAWSSLPRDRSFSADWRICSRLAAILENSNRDGARCRPPIGPSPTLRDDPVVTQAMLRAGAVPAERLPVLRRSVSLVVLESVDGKAARERVEEPVAVDLGDDRGRRDRGRERVPVDDRQLRQPHAWDDEPRRPAAHRPRARAVTARRMASRLARRMSPTSMMRASTTPMAHATARADSPIQLLPSGGVETLRVDLRQDAPRRQDDGGGDDGSGQRAAARFIDARDAPVSGVERAAPPAERSRRTFTSPYRRRDIEEGAQPRS